MEARERPAVEMVPEDTGTTAQGSGCGACTAKSGSVRAQSCRVNWLVQAVALATAAAKAVKLKAVEA